MQLASPARDEAEITSKQSIWSLPFSWLFPGSLRQKQDGVNVVAWLLPRCEMARPYSIVEVEVGY